MLNIACLNLVPPPFFTVAFCPVSPPTSSDLPL